MLESILRTKAKEFQNLNNYITHMNERLDTLKSECENESAILQGLRQQAAKLESFVNNYKNDNGEYKKIIKSIEDKLHDSLSDKKKPNF
jgi:chromosome segregation ATPase